MELPKPAPSILQTTSRTGGDSLQLVNGNSIESEHWSVGLTRGEGTTMR